MKTKRNLTTLTGSLSKFSEDFMSERNQPPVQERASLDHENQNNTPLPEGWEWKKLGEIRQDRSAGIVPNKTPDQYFELYSVPSFERQVPEILSGKEIGSNKQIVEEGTVLLCKINPRINRAWVVSSHSKHNKIASTEWISFSPVADVDPKYLCYFLRQNEIRDFLAANVSGVGGSLMRVRPAVIKDYPFPVAPLPTQHLIVAEIEKQFSRLDEAVAGLKRIKANLKRYEAAVLKAAVEGKLTEDWRKAHPSVETGAELSKRILAERKKKWEEKNPGKKYKEPAAPDTSSLPELPKGWTWASIEMVADALGGNAFKSNEFVESGHQIVKMANIKMETLDLSQRPSFIRNVSDEVVDKYRIIDGDVLVTLTGTRKKRDYGYVVCVRTPQHSLLLNQRIARLRPYIRNHSEYIAIVLQSEEYRNRFFSSETGNVGQGNVGMKAVTVEAIPIPPLLEQTAMITEYEKAISVANKTEQEIDVNLKRGERLRQSILAKAFSGQLLMET